MPKYIDADALYETMCALWDRSDSEAFETEVFKLVQDAPVADVVEPIRCAHCEHYNPEERLCNDLMGFGRYWNEDNYCSYGERKE